MQKKKDAHTYITVKKTAPIIYCLQSLQGQLCSTYLRISVLKL